MVILGIEQLLAGGGPDLHGKRLGLLCNQASVDRNFVHSRDLIDRCFPNQLSCLFSPQHGFFAEKQDNMIESGHGHDDSSGLPLFSLYGEVRKPTPAMLDHLDVLLIDLKRRPNAARRSWSSTVPTRSAASVSKAICCERVSRPLSACIPCLCGMALP